MKASPTKPAPTQGRAVKLRWVMTNPPIKAPAKISEIARRVGCRRGESGSGLGQTHDTHLHSRHNGERGAPQHDGQHGGDRVMDRHGEDGQNDGCHKVNTQNGGRLPVGQPTAHDITDGYADAEQDQNPGDARFGKAGDLNQRGAI